MPKYGIHEIVMSKAIGRLERSRVASNREIASLLDRRRTAAMTGAVGPDIFFWAPDYPIGQAVYQVAKAMNEVERITDEMRKPLDELEEHVLDAAEGLVPHSTRLVRALNDQVKKLEEDLEDLAKNTLLTGLGGTFSGLADLAGASMSQFFKITFSPPVQPVHGRITPPPPEQNPEAMWYWFDMLHYRKSGDFARNLVQRALPGSGRPTARDERRLAFAYGYLSHIATDLVGHAYVNQVVGGPYRLQVHRHVTVENFMDTWAFDHYYGENVNQTLLSRLGFTDTLEPGLSDLLREALEDTYPVDPRGRPPLLPTTDDIEKAYYTFYEVLKMSSESTMEPPEPASDAILQALADALAQLGTPPPNPPSTPGACSFEEIFGASPTSSQCYDAFFQSLDDWASWLADTVLWMLDTIRDVIDLLLAAALSGVALLVSALVHGLRLLLFAIYQEMRQALALLGIVTPEPRMLDTSHGLFLVRPSQCGVDGTGPFGEWAYPRRMMSHEGHLTCPGANLEQLSTAPNFVNNFGVPVTSPDAPSPAQFIDRGPRRIRNLRRYAAAGSPDAVRELWRQKVRMGNATAISVWMIANALGDDDVKKDVFTNWNLDGDRGYGYHCWDGTILIDEVDATDAVADEVFVP